MDLHFLVPFLSIHPEKKVSGKGRENIIKV
jgi:hypothetical protein